jgi:hypothetical protein
MISMDILKDKEGHYATLVQGDLPGSFNSYFQKRITDSSFLVQTLQ